MAFNDKKNKMVDRSFFLPASLVVEVCFSVKHLDIFDFNMLN